MFAKKSTLFTKITYIFLAFALLLSGLGAMAQPALAAEKTTCTQTHVVERGEYLSEIAKQYEVSWRWLAEINNLKNPSLIYPGQKLCVALVDSATGNPVSPVIPVTGESPTFSIISVVKGRSVTIQVVNYPANLEFQVLMDKIGTRAVDGVKAGTATTGKDGSFKATFNIPSSLADQTLIAIRIEATGSSGHYAYNWFQNSTKSSDEGSTPTSGSASANRTLSIVEVFEDTSVSIKGQGFGASRTYIVYFDRQYGKGGTIGIKAGTILSARDGSIKATVSIPKALSDYSALAIRLQAADGSGSTISNWFANMDSDNDSGGGAPYSYNGGIPTVQIAGVNRGRNVTLDISHFPARQELKVLMGKIGTQGINGIEVTTIKTDRNGSYSETFKIPKELQDRKQIAVRVVAVDGSGYYAYNWFDNSNTQ